MVLRAIFGALALVLALCGGAKAQTCALPYSFTNGTIADANQVNANFSALLGCQNSIVGLPHLANNATLKALSTSGLTSTSRMWRDGFTLAGDGGGAIYTYSPFSCSLNLGVGDNGSQIAPTSGVGCWIGDFSGMKPTALVWGCKGDGAVDDTACLTKAVAWADTSGIPLEFDGTHKFLITTGITSTGKPVLQGMVAPGHIYYTSCPSGIIVNSDITPLTFNGPTFWLSNVCIQMATTYNVRASGAAVSAGATGSVQQGHGHIHDNTILYPYNAIIVGGATDGTTQTNTHYVSGNTIVDPINWGIAVGPESTNASSGILEYGDQIVCLHTQSTATGIALFDGGGEINPSTDGPYNCRKGTAITPGRHAGQIIGGAFFKGVLGDSSTECDLCVDTLNAAASMVQVKFNGTTGGGVTNSWSITSLSWANTANGCSGNGRLTVVLPVGVPAGPNVGDKFTVSGATNTGGGGSGAINATFNVDTVSDTAHFTLCATAAGGVFGTIGGTTSSSAYCPTGNLCGAIATDTQVKIRSTAGGTVRGLDFTGFNAHSSASQTNPIVDIDNADHISFTGGQLNALQGGTVTGCGFKIGTAASVITINGMMFGVDGITTFSNGICPVANNSNHGYLTVTGNDLTSVTNPIVYVPNGEANVIRNNRGVDDVCPSVATATTISFPNAATCVHLTGTTTVVNLTNSSWGGREVDVWVDGGFTFNTGGSPGICGGAQTLSANTLHRFRWNDASCWGVQ